MRVNFAQVAEDDNTAKRNIRNERNIVRPQGLSLNLAAFQLPGRKRMPDFGSADKTGCAMHTDVIGAQSPALRKLGLDMSHWTMKVKGIGSGYWRAVGTAEELIEKAAEIPRTWLCGVGFARFFNG